MIRTSNDVSVAKHLQMRKPYKNTESAIQITRYALFVEKNLKLKGSCKAILQISITVTRSLHAKYVVKHFNTSAIFRVTWISTWVSKGINVQYV